MDDDALHLLSTASKPMEHGWTLALRDLNKLLALLQFRKSQLNQVISNNTWSRIFFLACWWRRVSPWNFGHRHLHLTLPPRDWFQWSPPLSFVPIDAWGKDKRLLFITNCLYCSHCHFTQPFYSYFFFLIADLLFALLLIALLLIALLLIALLFIALLFIALLFVALLLIALLLIALQMSFYSLHFFSLPAAFLLIAHCRATLSHCHIIFNHCHSLSNNTIWLSTIASPLRTIASSLSQPSPVGSQSSPVHSYTAWRYIDKDSLEWPELGPIYTCTMTIGERQTPSDKLGLKQIFK